ncbi:MAG: hypothetical protein AAF928_19880 [Myxococcota bacterium]
MKPINTAVLARSAALLLAVATAGGCSRASVPVPEAPRTAQAADEDDEFDFILPSRAMQPEGSYEMSWEPAPPPPKRTVKPLETRATPEFVAPKTSKGRLFALPTKFEH